MRKPWQFGISTCYRTIADSRDLPWKGWSSSRMSWSRVLLLACSGALLFFLGRLAGAVQDGDKTVRADVVVAERFELRGPNGKSAASLRTNGRGEAALTFYGAGESIRMDLGISPKGEPSLTMYDAKFRPKLTLRVSAKEDEPRVELSSGQLINKSIMIGFSEGKPHLSILDTSIAAADRGSASMTLNDRGEPTLYLWGKQNKPRISLTAGDRGPRLSITSVDGSGRLHGLSIGANERGEVSIRSEGDIREPAVALSVNVTGPSLRLLGKGNESAISLSVIGGSPSIRMGKQGLEGPYTEWRNLPDGSPAIFIGDDKGMPSSVIRFGKDGRPTIQSPEAKKGGN